MALTAAARACVHCGAEVPGDALDGLCPRCVAPLAFGAAGPAEPACPVTDRERIRYVGDYELLEEIARGGMGVVYSARQVSLNRIVAVKMILAGQLASPADVRRFRAEAEAAATLQHPNIVAIHEIGEHNGQPFFSMDFIEGRSLAEWVREGPLPAKRAAAVMKAVAEAIHYAHERGILHRDLKPSNVVLDVLGEPHITDFGLAKQFGIPPSGGPGPAEAGTPNLLTSGLTLTGQVLGTPSFMSPEQVAGKRDRIGPASDVYALGAILYHLVTGRPPFQGETLQQVFDQVANTSPLSPRLLNPSLPRDLDTICLKCLEKEPAKRYTSAAAFADDLERFLNDEPIHARPVGPTGKAWRWCRRNRTASVSGALIVALVAGFSWHNWRTVTELRNTAPSLIALAESLVTAQRFPEALERVEVALRLQPRNADYLTLKGTILLGQLRVAEARDHFARALSFNPSLASASERLTLSERLRASRSGQSEWTTDSLIELYHGLMQQGRSAEAYAVSKHIDAAETRFVTHLQERLTRAGITNQLYWTEHRPAGLREPTNLSAKRPTLRDTTFLALKFVESGIADLSPLKGIPLQELTLTDCTNVADLGPLRGMPLTHLDFSWNKVTDLSPLSDMPLEVLNFSFVRVSDLSPLRRLSTLRSLRFHNVDVGDLGPLSGLRLETLMLGSIRATSLEPLRGIPLSRLDLSHVKTADLSPLADLPLQDLRIRNANVSDLSPLRGLPLRVLHLISCPLITDLSALNHCQTLEQLVFPPNARDIEFLRTLANLKEISYTEQPLPAAEFWKAYQVPTNPLK